MVSVPVQRLKESVFRGAFVSHLSKCFTDGRCCDISRIYVLSNFAAHGMLEKSVRIYQADKSGFIFMSAFKKSSKTMRLFGGWL